TTNVPYSLSSGGPSGLWKRPRMRGGADEATATSSATLDTSPVRPSTRLNATWSVASPVGSSVGENVTVTFVVVRGARKNWLGVTLAVHPSVFSGTTLT